MLYDTDECCEQTISSILMVVIVLNVSVKNVVSP